MKFRTDDASLEDQGGRGRLSAISSREPLVEENPCQNVREMFQIKPCQQFNNIRPYQENWQGESR